MASEIKPILNDEDNDAAIREVERLWGAKLGTPEGDRLDVLATLISAYEAKRYPVTRPDPIEAPASGTTAHPDAALLAASARYQVLEAEYRRRIDADVLTARGGDEYEGVVADICDTPAATLDGLRAKAAAIYTFYEPDFPWDSIFSQAVWGVIAQLAGKPLPDWPDNA